MQPIQPKSSKLTVIEKQREDGIYVWRTPQGVVSNEAGDIMNIPARKGDLSAMARLRNAAIYYGFPEGEAEFRPGIRRITDEEHSEQLDRMKQGLIPSETDIGAWMDAERGQRKHGSD
jgi:hypothetical protein